MKFTSLLVFSILAPFFLYGGDQMPHHKLSPLHQGIAYGVLGGLVTYTYFNFYKPAYADHAVPLSFLAGALLGREVFQKIKSDTKDKERNELQTKQLKLLKSISQNLDIIAEATQLTAHASLAGKTPEQIEEIMDGFYEIERGPNT